MGKIIILYHCLPMSRRIKYIVIGILLSIVNPCFSQTDSPNFNKIGFCEKFNNQFNNANILLACIVYSNKINKDSVLTEKDKFIKIAGDFQSNAASNINFDSTVDTFVQQHREMNFDSDKTKFAMQNFIENYIIVEDLVFSKIKSDDDAAEMQIFENKILKLHDATIIYRSYINGQRDMSSLSSAEGIALNIQLAYYLSQQNMYTRNEIIKALL
jgi:hypothetical protein